MFGLLMFTFPGEYVWTEEKNREFWNPIVNFDVESAEEENKIMESQALFHKGATVRLYGDY